MNAYYWPWWLGGPLLAFVAVLYPLLTRAPLGVSGALARLLRWRTEGKPEPSPEPAPAANPGCGDRPGVDPAPAAGCVAGPDRFANLIFLLAIAAGGAVGGWWGGQPPVTGIYSPEFHRIFGSGVQGLVVLFSGGVLVGFGTRLSGGCTSGHGLSGCGRLQPASLVATAVFFGVAIGVSFLLEALKR